MQSMISTLIASSWLHFYCSMQTQNCPLEQSCVCFATVLSKDLTFSHLHTHNSQLYRKSLASFFQRKTNVIIIIVSKEIILKC